MSENMEYDIAISYAGEDRQIAEVIANTLRKRGVRIFYDKLEEEKVKIWGKDLIEYLSEVYGKKSRYCLLLISKSYPIKPLAKFELKFAQDRQFKESNEYLLPLRIDDTEIPGLPPTIAYLDWREETLESICEAIAVKIGMKTSIKIDTDEVLYSKLFGTIIQSGIQLTKVKDIALSSVESIRQQSSFYKFPNSFDRYGCYLSLNGGSRIVRLWVSDQGNLTAKEVFIEGNASHTTMSGDVFAWIDNGRIVLRH